MGFRANEIGHDLSMANKPILHTHAGLGMRSNDGFMSYLFLGIKKPFMRRYLDIGGKRPYGCGVCVSGEKGCYGLEPAENRSGL
jgi:hypothetical protein